MIEEAGKMTMYLYKGYWIKKGPFGWYAVPVDKVAHANEERYGYSINMSCKESVESWIDDKEV